MRTVTALSVIACVLFVGLIAQTAIAMDAKSKVFQLTHQTVDCDGVRMVIETDHTDAHRFARDKCENYDFRPD